MGIAKGIAMCPRQSFLATYRDNGKKEIACKESTAFQRMFSVSRKHGLVLIGDIHDLIWLTWKWMWSR